MQEQDGELLHTALDAPDNDLHSTGFRRSGGSRRLEQSGWAALRSEVTGVRGCSPVDLLALQWMEHHVPSTQIQDIAALATDVIGDEREGARWLSEPNLATDNRPPIELMGEKDGFERVKNLLMRIEYGVLA